jgi:7,8-dihydropterin-6-yl-methyl-4-(beta-D-ribofuranosyl)aminobenzene 5'-phosphate synthase
MKIVTLLENTTENDELVSAHGLSLYIETGDKKILFDIGPSNLYMRNAKKLGINIAMIDTLIISHGHYDHGTGLQKFLKKNKVAKVYVSRSVFNEHIKAVDNKYEFIGIKKPSNVEDRIVYVDNDIEINEDITIYKEVPFKKQIISDDALMVYENERYLEDHFDHEIYLSIQEDENHVLFSGCSHKGIEHIVDTLELDHKIEFTQIIGGFHFSHYDSFDFNQTDYLIRLGAKFNNRDDTIFYSCHCTGDEAYRELKSHMKSNLKRIRTGSVIKI